MRFLISSFLVIILISCSTDSPYPEFESKYKNQICECIVLAENNDIQNILKEYEDCSRKISEILKTGLDPYPTNTAVTKEEYLAQLPVLTQKLAKQCALVSSPSI